MNTGPASPGRMKCRITPAPLTCDACRRLAPSARCPALCARNFVLGGWSSSLKHSRDAGMITAKNYRDVMHAEIAEICARPECHVLVAVGDAADVFLGFIAGEPAEHIVYYCFVKELYRQRGVARSLFEALGVDPRSRFVFPCETRASLALSRKIPLAIHDTAVARYPKPDRHRSYT